MVDELTAATGFAMEVKRRKPLKICNSARSRALGIVAESLRELKEIASSKFGLVAAKCRVCLDSDGTEIENEEYFSFLEDQTKLLILGDGERWTDGLQSGKEKETNTKSRKGKVLSTKAGGKETEVATNVNKLLKVRTNRSNLFATNFISDMQDLESESSDDDMPLMERLSQSLRSHGELSSFVNKRKAPEQAKESTPQGDKMQVDHLIRRHSLKGQRRTHASVSSSREAILGASAYKSLFTMPEHSRPRRKEALETSVIKVAEWLSANNMSSTSGAHNSDSDEGTIDVDGEIAGGSEVSEEKRVDEEPDTAAMKTNDGEDLDNDNDNDDEDVSSLNEVEDNGSIGCRMAEVYSKEKAPTEKMVRYLGKDVELKTCRVKIYKLPVSVGNGRPRVVDGLQSPINRTSQSENETAQSDEEEENDTSSPLYLTPVKNLPEGQIVWLKEKNAVTKTTEEQAKKEEGNKDVLEVHFVGNETVVQQPKRSMSKDVELEIVTQDVDGNQSEHKEERNTVKKRGEEDEDDFQWNACRESSNDGAVASNVMVDENVDQEQVIEDSTEKEGDKNEEQAGLKRDDNQLTDMINGERANRHMEGSKHMPNRVGDQNVENGLVTQNLSEKESYKECDEMSVENVELEVDPQNLDEQTSHVEHGKSGNENKDFSDETAMKSCEECHEVVSRNELGEEKVELGVVPLNPVENKERGSEGCEDVSIEDVNTFVSHETARECTNLGLENERERKILEINDDTLVKNVARDDVDGDNMVSNKTVVEEVETIDSNENIKENETKRNEGVPVKTVTRDLSDLALISRNTAKENGEEELSAKKMSDKNEGTLEINDDRLVINVHQECVGDEGNDSENTFVEETVRLELAKKPNVRKIKHKKNECELVKNAARKCVDDDASVAGETVEGDMERALVTQDSIASSKPRKRKRKILELNEEGPVENSVEQCVSDRDMVSTKAETIDREFDVTLESGGEKSEDVLIRANGSVKKTKHKKKRKESNGCEVAKNAVRKCVDDDASVAGETVEGDMERALVTQDSIASSKPRKRKRKRLELNEEGPVENSVEQCVSDRDMVSTKAETIDGELDITQESGGEKSKDVLVHVNGLVNAIDVTTVFTKSMSKNMELEFEQKQRNEKKSKRKKKKKNENERVNEDGGELLKNGHRTSFDNGSIASKGITKGTMAHEQVTRESTGNKVDRNENQARLQGGDDILENKVRRESVSVKMKVTENILNASAEDGNLELEFVRQKPSEERSKRKKRRSKSKEDISVKGDIKEDSSEKVSVSRKMIKEIVTHDITKETSINDGFELNGKTEEEQRSSSVNVFKTPKSSAVDRDDCCEDEREAKDKKRKNRKRKRSHSNDGEGNPLDHLEKKKTRKTEEKRRIREKTGKRETERIPALLNLEKAESLDDSGYSEHSSTVIKQSHPRLAAEGESVTESTVSKIKKEKISVEAPADQGHGKKKSKALFSLLDLALDDTAGPKHPSTPSNRQTPVSEGRSSSQIRRHFRDKPKGFTRVVQNRKFSTPIRTPLAMARRPRTEPKKNFNREKVKSLVPSNVSFDQALEDYLWET